MDEHTEVALNGKAEGKVDEAMGVQEVSALTRYDWIDRNAVYYDDLERFFAFQVEPGATVVEIGHGVGRILRAVRPSRGAGLERDAATKWAGARQKPGASLGMSSESLLEVWDGTGSLPKSVVEAFPQGVDYILVVNGFGYFPDIQESLSALHPLCHANTRIISVYYNFLWAPVLRAAQYLGLRMPQREQNWFSLEDVAAAFRYSGYQLIKTGYRALLPAGPRVVSRFVNRWFGNLPGFNRLGCVEYVVARPRQTWRQEDIHLSIVIPARNEKGNIQRAVDEVEAAFTGRQERVEIVFVEGNSTDGTYAEINQVVNAYEGAVAKGVVQCSQEEQRTRNRRLSFVVCQQGGKGKGDAVRVGFARATGNLFVILDADLTVAPAELPKFLDVYEKGYGEFINGSRLVYKMESEAMRFFNLLGNKFFSMAFSWLLAQRFKDTLCGTKMLSRSNYERIVRNRHYFGDFDPFGDFDLLFGAYKLNLEIAEVPVHYLDRTYGSTNISRWKHGWLLLRMCLFASRKIKFI